MPRIPWILPAALLVVVAAAATPRSAGAQGSTEPPPASVRAAAPAEPFTPSGHWSREALRRLGGLGLLDAGAVAVAWPVGRDRVRKLLTEAAAAAERAGDAGAAALAAGFLHRFELEYPAPDGTSTVRWGGRFDAGWAGEYGAMRGGSSEWVDDVGWVYGGPVPVPDGSAPFAAPALDLGVGSVLALSVAIHDRWGRTRAEEAYATARRGGIDLWAGRRALSLGPSSAKGLVLSDGVPFHGVGIEVPDGVPLPGALDALGLLRGAMLVARMERSGQIARPWFWALRLGFAPAPSLSIGVNRAAIFGGDGNEAVTPRNLALMLVGFTDASAKSSDFENQVASVDILWRIRTGGLPLTLYAEWGAEDMGGAWRRVPGILTGVEIPSMPGAPALAAGIERVAFSGSGGGNPPWYRHGALGEGWTDGGRLFGHPLGGHGREWSVRARFDPSQVGVMLSARLRYRNRREENLFAPDRTGSSVGADLDLLVHRVRGLRFETGLEFEEGRSRWRRWAGRATIGTSF